MKKLISILLLFIFCCVEHRVVAQNEIDSLKGFFVKLSLKKGLASDTLKYNVLMKIGLYYRNIDIDSAISYHQKANIIALQVKDDLRSAESIRSIATDYQSKSSFQEALKYNTQSQNLAKKHINSSNEQTKLKALKLQSVALYNLGAIYKSIARYPIALEYFLAALKIQEKFGLTIVHSRILAGIGSIYQAQGEIQKGLEFYKRSLKISEKLNDKINLCADMTNIGGIYYAIYNDTTAMSYYSNALKLAEEINLQPIQSTLNLDLGLIYASQNNYSMASVYYTKGLTIAENLNQKELIAKILIANSEIFKKQKKYLLAEKYLQKGLRLAQELESLENIKQAHENFYQIYGQTNRSALALESYKQYIIYRDSITNVENDKAIIQKELQYNYDKKATADSIVNAKAQEIKDAQLAKNKLEIKAKQNQQYALFGGLALVLVFAGFMYNRFKITQRQKVIIEEQKKLVDISQKKTMDSINYAKKIQHSILPSSEQLGAVFPNHFIFFKPKDVVSGDFYWFHHQNNLSFIAVADCTGHGVPGAFMTMIGYSNLIEVVAQQKVIEPNKILENLHQHIFNNLQQNKGDAYSQDGMDISLVVIDHENSLLHFSAAYNHGYLIHNKQIHTLKATSKSIGGLSILGEIEPERNFKAETIAFTKGSLLVLTTDGIFDQLNKQDEKFGNERFKDLVINFNTENVQENLQLVEQTYSNWKQDANQLDDLCLLGIVI